MKAHTPGPWTLHPERWGKDGSYHQPVVVDARLQKVAEIRIGLDGSEGNGALISAAPDLADSVEELIEGQGTDDGQLCHKGLCSAEQCGRCRKILRARRALVKAGRS